VTELGDATWVEAAEFHGRAAVLAVPLGSTEQHGPHLPLSTDTDLAVALTRRLAVARPAVVVAPAVPYGSSGEHQDFAGTLSIGQDALHLLLVELGRSACLTFDRVLFVCGHGGNAEPLARAVALLRAESRDVWAWLPRWRGDPHAGRTETSLQLALDPARVHLERAEPGDTRPMSELLPLLRAGSVSSVTSNGVLGDPTGADAATGHALLGELTADLVRDFDARVAGAVR
jgi:mycofactocin system creatininase family protein